MPAIDATFPTTLVTGASSGVGRALALQLAAANVRVLALGRDAARLNEIARPGRIEPIVADLSDLQALPALARTLRTAHDDLGCVIHNAGVQFAGRFDDDGYAAEAIEHELAVNLAAPMLLTHALLPHLLRRSNSWIVSVGSGLAYAPKSGAAVYSATKAGLRAFDAALRLQLRGSGVHVMSVVLPLVDTPMTAGRGRDKLSADDAAAAILRGLSTNAETCFVGRARAIPLLQRVAPTVLARVLARS